MRYDRKWRGGRGAARVDTESESEPGSRAESARSPVRIAEQLEEKSFGRPSESSPHRSAV